MIALDVMADVGPLDAPFLLVCVCAGLVWALVGRNRLRADTHEVVLRAHEDEYAARQEADA
jgi:hypothetical protein